MYHLLPETFHYTTITMADGAAIEGVCSQTYAKVSPTEFFKQFEAKEEKKNG